MKQRTPMNRSQRERWLDTATKYGGHEADWEKISQYAPTQDDSQKTRNHQYDVDYPQPEMSSFDGIHI